MFHSRRMESPAQGWGQGAMLGWLALGKESTMERRSCPFCEVELPADTRMCHLCGRNLDEVGPWRRFLAKAKGWLILIAIIVVICLILILARGT